MKGLAVFQPPPYPIPSLLPFRAGGFYDAGIPFDNTGAGAVNNDQLGWLIPTWIPTPSLLVNLGIEVTTFNNAANCRIGVYDSAYVWDGDRRRPVLVPFPDKLICETDVVSLGTSNAYKNGAVTYRNGYKKLPQGLAWVAFNQYGTAATYRVGGTNLRTAHLGCGTILRAGWTEPWGCINFGQFTLVAAPGWPRRWPLNQTGANALWVRAGNQPLVKMEF